MRRAAVAVLGVLLGGCVPQDEALRPDEADALLPHALVAGVTTRRDVIQEYGIPTQTLDHESVWSYRLRHDGDGTRLAVVTTDRAGSDREGGRGTSGNYRLLLSFDREVLEKWRLIRLR